MDPFESDTVRPLRDAEAPPVPAAPLSWPPRIPASFAPGWIRIRDLVLTLVAWAAYVWILREPVIAGVNWLSPSAGAALKQTFGVTPDIDIRPFLWIAAGLVAWLVVIAMLEKPRLQRQPSPDNVTPALSPDDQFAAAGVPAAQVAVCRGAGRLRVDHDARGRIVRIEADPAPESNLPP
jgi:poly-beta-1,6-N-acetyl-D-glucosamine biosynthesis protein PgaD